MHNSGILFNVEHGGVVSRSRAKFAAEVGKFRRSKLPSTFSFSRSSLFLFLFFLTMGTIPYHELAITFIAF